MSQEHNQMIDIVNVPIESLKDRYSENWNQHFPQALAGMEGVRSVYTVYPETELSDTVVQGQFLNVLDTNLFKAKQIAEIVELFKQGRIGNSTVIFFHDLWFQGIESLFYIRDALGIKFKIAGMLHAGTWDHHDFLSHKRMGRWARKIEESWLNEIDLPLVSTHFHKVLIEGRRGPVKNLKVVPFPLWHLESLSPFKTKENIVVFPHRLADEKNPAMFDELAKLLQHKLPDWKFVKTKDVCKSKSTSLCLNAVVLLCLWQRRRLGVSPSLKPQPLGVLLLYLMLCLTQSSIRTTSSTRFRRTPSTCLTISMYLLLLARSLRSSSSLRSKILCSCTSTQLASQPLTSFSRASNVN
jgi:hypothetical protein